ncbi:MAG: transposase [Rhodobacteraceae bacterium]|nr:transposase [Paracoccaceae bacterium]
MKRRVGYDLVRRMRDDEEAVLLFVRDPWVPPANNLAKRALRPEKTRIKISGCHRSESGAHNRAVMMTVLGTAGKGWNL